MSNILCLKFFTTEIAKGKGEVTKDLALVYYLVILFLLLPSVPLWLKNRTTKETKFTKKFCQFH